jgi:hypothetical protein
MVAPTRNTLTDVYQITIDFVELQGVETGDSQILSYHGMWKESTSAVWLDMNLESTQFTGDKTLSVYDNLQEGLTYNFKIRASNVYGFGPFSSITSILASSWPAKS